MSSSESINNLRNDSCIDPSLDLNLLDSSHSPADSCPSLDYSVDSIDNADFPSDTRKERMSGGGASFVYITAREKVLCKVQNLKDSFCTLGISMDAKFNDGATVVELPSTEEGSPIATT